MAGARTDEVYVGRDYGGRQIEITPELVKHYAASVQDHNPWYFGDSPFGGPVAPALLLHSEVFRDISWYLSFYGNLHAKQEWDLFHPMMVGDTVSTRSTIVDRYVKRNREYVVNEVTYQGADGRVLSRGKTHQSFLLETHGEVVVDKDREMRSDRRFELGSEESLEELPPLTKDVTLEMCQKFSGPHKNYHNDIEEARKLGFPDIVVQGMMSMCFLSQLMTERFGTGWYVGGRLSVGLVNVLWQKESVTCRGRVNAMRPEGSRRRAELQVWCEKPEGTKVVVGTASAVTG